MGYPDSGATHNIMNDSNNFTTKLQYQGNEVVGNGAGMPIKHIGSASYALLFKFNDTIVSKNLLHSPRINKNLICFINSLWYPNSGATHNITNDSNNFTSKLQYQGNEVVGNAAHQTHWFCYSCFTT